MPPILVSPSWYEDYWLTEFSQGRSLFAGLWVGWSKSAGLVWALEMLTRCRPRRLVHSRLDRPRAV